MLLINFVIFNHISEQNLLLLHPVPSLDSYNIKHYELIETLTHFIQFYFLLYLELLIVHDSHRYHFLFIFDGLHHHFATLNFHGYLIFVVIVRIELINMFNQTYFMSVLPPINFLLFILAVSYSCGRQIFRYLSFSYLITVFIPHHWVPVPSQWSIAFTIELYFLESIIASSHVTAARLGPTGKRWA